MAQSFAATTTEPGSAQVLLSADSGSVVQRTVLPSGLRIITESMPGTRSASFGVWVGSGSRDEAADQHGAAHYLEHLLFRGTARRGAFEINAAIDAIGGEMNAFTSREATCFYAHVRDADLPIAVEVVTDVVTGGLMREPDVASERHVVLEEIAMHEDDPGDVAMEQFYRQVLADGALSRPILGTPESIEALPGARIRDYYAEHYVPGNTVVAVAGGVEHEQVVELVAAAMDASGWSRASGAPHPVRSGPAVPGRAASCVVVRRPAEQAHLLIGGSSLARNDPDKYALAVFNSVLGGGMSSRLFQRVREERGLAYSVYSFAAPFADTGVFGVYAGTRPRHAEETVAVIGEVLASVAASGISEQELVRGKGAVRGARILALEDPFARMNRLAHAELMVGELPSLEAIEQRIGAVTVPDVARVAERLLARAHSITAVGPMPPDWAPVLPVAEAPPA